MAKPSALKIGPRDEELLAALDHSPFTAAQLLALSESFTQPFPDEHTVRRRLRQLATAGLVKAFPYAVASLGRSPSYYRLTRRGYQHLHGLDAPLPHRRAFEAVADAHHHHTLALAEFLVHVFVAAHKAGIEVRGFARENSVTIETATFTLRPDCAFQLVTAAGRQLNFVVELDNGTERVRSQLDTESIERKVRGYDAHQQSLAAFDPARYVVLFVTTRSAIRLSAIMDTARRLAHNPQRRLFLGITLADFLTNDNPLLSKRVTEATGSRGALVTSSPNQTAGHDRKAAFPVPESVAAPVC
jgi:predicted ArsR family transcriptional regulator